ncbi:ATP-dependent helicase [Patescibacteria group bacterium]
MDLSKLNKEQLEAVTHENGPLLIIAGAGTGKTHVITSRILYLLQDKKVTTNSILALTFTEKATEEMIERIDMALPYSYEELSIHTFHGFCDRVLKEKGLEIGLDTSYKILTQIDQWMFIKKHLFDFDLDYYRPLGNPSKFISALGTHFSRLKDEDIPPEKYLEYAEKQDEDRDRLLELANAYKKYQELLIKDNLMDFNDLQYYVLRLFEQRPLVLKEYQDRFKHILVDEFQDTNFAQSKIVHTLAKAHQNLTVVGDDDQSIYRWRGASMNNINEFNREFPDAKKIVLKENYRSTPEILNATYELIQNNNPFRLEASHKVNKRLNSQFENSDKIQVNRFATYLNEYKFIVQQINQLTKEYDYKDIAILVRTHSIAKPLIEALKTNQIPFQVKSSESLTTLPEIKDLIAILKFISNPNENLSLFRILQMPIYNFPMATLISLINKAKHEQLNLLEVVREEDYLKKTVELFGNLVEFSKDHNISQILSEFLNRSKYLHKLQEESTYEDEEKLINIAEFVKMAQEYDAQHNDNSIYNFLDYLKLLEEAGARLESTIEEIDHDAVQISTIHAAKGLQFPIVFIPSLVHTRFPGRNMSDPIQIPDELITEEIPDKDMHIYEERRLMYVAATRAKEKLFLTYSEKYEGTKKWKPSVFIKEFEGLPEVESHENIEIVEEVVKESKPRSLELSPAPTKLSYSKLTCFEACPLKYKFRYLYNLPAPLTSAANFGVSVHNTLNEFYEGLKEGKKADLEVMNELYEKNWIPYGYESRAHHNARKHQGLKIMKDYYEDNSEEWKIPEMLERAFNLKVGKYAFSGRIDRIDKLNDGTYEVIDYKTGKSKKGSKLEKDLQLSLYALACRDVYGIDTSKLSLYFLEDNEKQSTSRTNEDLDKAEEEICTKADALMNSDFCATPGFACKFCEYRLICNKAVH